MAGLGRFTAVLGLFRNWNDGVPTSWSVPAMAQALGEPVSTLYRTVRELMAAGFLEQAAEGGYRLGPAFIEFDRILRLSDPLVRNGRPVLSDVVRQAGIPCVAILARLYNHQVMCVGDEAAPGTGFRSSYERGRPMPTTRGATSKVILAHLPSRELNRLIGGRNEMPELRQELVAIRKAGHFVTASEIDPGLAGVAAPVVVEEQGISASLTLVAEEANLDDSLRRRLVLLVVSAAGLLAEDIRSHAVAHAEPMLSAFNEPPANSVTNVPGARKRVPS